MRRLSLTRLLSQTSRLWHRHSLWRLSLSIAVMLWLIVALALLAIYQLSIQPLLHSQRQLIAQHVEQIQSAHELNPAEPLEDQLRDSLYQNESILTVIKDPQGHVQGSLTHVPSFLTPCPMLKRFPVYLDSNDTFTTLEGCTFEVADNQILVATDNSYIHQIQENFINAALIVMACTSLIAFLPGLVVQRQLTRQLDQIHRVVAQIEQGQFSSRIALRGREDEWDNIALYINQMLDEIESSISQIQAATDAIAHDLRTPMTRIKNRLDLLDSCADPTQQQQHIHQLNQEFDSMLRTFNAMLELSKLETMHDRSAFTTLDLTKIVNDAIELAELQLEQKHQTIQASLTPTPFKGQPSLLFRLVYNLIENAHHHCNEGAKISIALNHRQLIVADNGPGIAPEHRQKVFRRLFRVDKSRHTPGHGLGLSLVAVVAKLHQAHISLDYTDDKNATGLKVTIQF